MIRELLALDDAGDDRFAAAAPAYDYRPTLFGGQVAGQALRAAALTVGADRPPHSLHSYFVRPGRLDEPLVMQVERVRDGRSFSVRGVEAWQAGEVILDMVASFHAPEGGDRYAQPYPDVGDPDDVAPDPFQSTGFAGPSIEMRMASETAVPEPPFGTVVRFWVRSTEPWDDDDQGLAAAYLAYVADLRTGTALVDHSDMQSGRVIVASLDHSLWFHDRVSPADWLLVDLRRVAIGNHRGLVLGTMHAHDRRHVASFTQELVVRPKRPPRTEQGEAS
jgi:acyl-CoA thioesterase II